MANKLFNNLELESKIEKINILISSISKIDNGIYERYNISLIESVKQNITNLKRELNEISTFDDFRNLPDKSKIPLDRIEIVYQGALYRVNYSIDQLIEKINTKNWTFEYSLYPSFKDYINRYEKGTEKYITSFERFGNIELKSGFQLLKIKHVLGITSLLNKNFVDYQRQMLIVDNNFKIVLSLNANKEAGDKLKEYSVKI